MELCCSVNGDRKCTKCSKTFCESHIYPSEEFRYTSFDSIVYVCFDCYAIYVRKLYIEAPREGLTFAELYQAVRQITPTGYISIEVKLQDFRPGIAEPELQWQIYHEKLSHCVGKTPEQAFAQYKAALEARTDKSTPLANVNI